jgi:lipopolysaccharide/colanic/teichoic acid biosynthesis glycosyltransferase
MGAHDRRVSDVCRTLEAPGQAVEFRPCDVALRVLDITAATVGLLILAVPILLIAIAIRIDSRGPVFYRCQRVGRRGTRLAVLKFRKMRDGAIGAALTLQNDARFTRLGRVLAKYKLDELPQLWNVLRGQMSLVGPRPEDRQFVNLYPREYDAILSVRPGITGLTQLAFGYCESQLLNSVDPEDAAEYYAGGLLPRKMDLDRCYVGQRSIRMWVAIVWWTMLAAVRRYDVAVNRTTGRLCRRRRPSLGYEDLELEDLDLEALAMPQSSPVA